ncbi:MAG TPA: hypothetical protein VGJ84_17845 [Polyangiaceae bacterium]|jgi:hypothetical protein
MSIFAHGARHAGDIPERPSGVPPPWRLGASRGELISVVVAVSVLLLLALSFWLEAGH